MLVTSIVITDIMATTVSRLSMAQEIFLHKTDIVDSHLMDYLLVR